jgi:hypothetical protein
MDALGFFDSIDHSWLAKFVEHPVPVGAWCG